MANWVTEARTIWHEETGGYVAHGRIGKPLKPVVEEYGWDAVKLALRYYLKVAILQHATPERFVMSYKTWSVAPKVAAQPPQQFREVFDGKRLRLVAEESP